MQKFLKIIPKFQEMKSIPTTTTISIINAAPAAITTNSDSNPKIYSIKENITTNSDSKQEHYEELPKTYSIKENIIQHRSLSEQLNNRDKKAFKQCTIESS